MKHQKIYEKVDNEKRDNIIQSLSTILSGEENILFAYLHGSFQEELPFRDLDIAVYLKEAPQKEQLDFELKLEDKIEQIIKYPIDLKVLNHAPVSFGYMVIKKGKKLLVRNDSGRAAFETATLKKYFDFLPYRERYLKEVLNA